MLDSYLAIAEHPLLWVFLGLTVVFFLIQHQFPEDQGKAPISPGQWLRGHYVAVILTTVAVLAILALAFYLVDIGLSVGTLVDRLRLAAAYPNTDAEALRNLAYAVAALLGVMGVSATIFFSVIKVWINERTASTLEQGQITDRINKAVEGLGASKEVNRLGRNIVYTRDGDMHRDFEWKSEPLKLPEGAVLDAKETGEWKNVALSEPNLEVRIGAIYALERIAQDSDRDHVQIMEILCAYIRQNAPAHDASKWPELEMKEGEDDGPLEYDWKERVEAFKDAHKKAIASAAVREDIQTALNVIGRRRVKQRALEARWNGNRSGFVFDEIEANLPLQIDSLGDLKLLKLGMHETQMRIARYRGYRPDLRNVNLRGADLSGLDLNGVRLAGSHLEGANLENASLKGADLEVCHLQGARLYRAKMAGANLKRSVLTYANLEFAALQGANLQEAQLRNAKLSMTCLVGAKLTKAKLQGAMMYSTDMSGASLLEARFQQMSSHAIEFIGAALDGASLQNATLLEAKLQGTSLMGVNLNSETNLSKLDFSGAAIRSVDATTLDRIKDHLPVMFSDGSLELPDDVVRPAHWAKQVLDRGQFVKHWQAWLATVDLDALARETG